MKLRIAAVFPLITGVFAIPLSRAADQTANSDPQSLQQIVVTGAQIPIEESIIPTVRNTNLGLGLDLNVRDIPRNVTIISRAQLDDIHINDVRDFTKLTSSAYTQSNFGAPTVPSIRGSIADIFVNGMREGLSSNGNGLPVDFNSVESVDIFKGPPTVIYGASNYVGGFVNLDTKRPYFDRFQGSVSATVGTYDQYRWTVDAGGPIIPDKLAFRVSYSGEDSGSYYENGLRETHSIYAALTWTPSDKYSLALNADYFFGSYTENFGFNRVTQNLIDNGQYFKGTVPGAPTTIGGGGNPIVPDGLTGLDRQIRLLKPGDGSYGQSFRGQAIQTLTLNENISIVNNTLVQYIDRHTRSSYYYSEIIAPAFQFENRTEVRLNFDIPIGGGGSSPVVADTKSGDAKEAKAPVIAAPKPFVIGNQVNLGIDLRYTEVTAYDDFFDEPANAWDLSLGRSLITYTGFNSFTSQPVPGHPGFTATPGVYNGDTNYSKLFVVSPFYEHRFQFGEYFSLIAGARADVIWVKVNDPLYFEAARAGNIGGVTPGSAPGDHTVVVDPNFNVSPSFKPFKWLTTYFTYDYAISYATGNGGGFPAGSAAGNGNTNISVKSELKAKSDLYEVGAKASFLQDTLFVTTALFLQDRNRPGIGAGLVKERARGFEIETDYQPSRNFYLSAGYSYLNSFVHGSPGFVAQVYPVDDPRQQLPDGTVITDNGRSLNHGVYRTPGLPHHLFNFLAKYEVPTSLGTFGVILGNTVTGPFFNGYGGYVTIPWQYEMDLTFLYKTKDDHFEARLGLLNLTDQKNWSPPNPVYGYDSVVAEWPFHIEGTLTYKF